MLPPDWQARMIEMIRGAAPLEGEWFAGGPTLDGLGQIAVYKRQYALRLYDALVVEIPGLRHLLGDQGEPLLRRYLLDTPSRSWSLNRVADALPEWLEEQDRPAAHVDMARLDRAVMAGFEAAEGRPLRVEDLSDDPVLELQPPVSLLRLRANVHLVRSAVLREVEPPPLAAADVPLVVFRRGIRMRHWAVDPAAWALLWQFRAPQRVGAALDAVVADGVDPALLGAGVGGWFRDFAERGLVQVVV